MNDGESGDRSAREDDIDGTSETPGDDEREAEDRPHGESGAPHDSSAWHDEQFAQIIANWRDPEDGDRRDESNPPPGHDGPDGTWRGPGEEDPLSRFDAADAELDRRVEAGEDDGEGFVPPDPPLPVVTDTLGALSWLFVVIAPIGVLIVTVFFSGQPRLVLWLLIAGFFAGVLYLFSRLPTERDPSDDGSAI